MFGSVAYAHVPDQRRMKLEDKSERYIFIWYDGKTKEYKLREPISKMMIVSHNVRVNEASEWDWNNSTDVNIEVEESSIATPTDSEIFNDEDEPRQPKMRSFRVLYDSTNEVHLVCLMADAENISFEEAVRDTKWQTDSSQQHMGSDKITR